MTTDYLRVAPAADDTLKDLLDGMEPLREQLRRDGVRRLLVDLRPLRKPPGPVENLLLSHHTAQLLGRLERIAVVLPMAPTGGGEEVARRMGATLRAFTCETQALDWLRG